MFSKSLDDFDIPQGMNALAQTGTDIMTDITSYNYIFSENILDEDGTNDKPDDDYHILINMPIKVMTILKIQKIILKW